MRFFSNCHVWVKGIYRIAPGPYLWLTLTQPPEAAMTLSRRTVLTAFAAAPLAAMIAPAARAGIAPIYAEQGIAIDGTDPVVYFTQGAPVVGNPEITFDYMRTT